MVVVGVELTMSTVPLAVPVVALAVTVPVALAFQIRVSMVVTMIARPHTEQVVVVPVLLVTMQILTTGKVATVLLLP
jgi:hypothetical protein